jgi:hypothetical protein
MAMQTGLAVVLSSVLCGLVPLAHATPPDPAWGAGIYDGADLDDVVTLVEATKVTLGNEAPVPRLVQQSVALPPATVVVAVAPRVRPSSTRAPPRPLRAIV